LPQTRKQRTRQLLAACLAAAATVVAGALLIEGAASTVKSAAEGACAALRPSPLTPALRALVPNFELPDLTGKTVSLRSLLGRPVLVSFFATWCPPCVEEAPSLEELGRHLGNKATVAVVSVDEDLDALKKFYAKGSQTLVMRDESRKVPESFGTSKFPESFLLDAAGKVRYAFINKRDWSTPEAAACVEGLK
jgi:cytochrome c biogenesis protein CcmG, thiol:disulfide interchange protein DsbE